MTPPREQPRTLEAFIEEKIKYIGDEFRQDMPSNLIRDALRKCAEKTVTELMTVFDGQLVDVQDVKLRQIADRVSPSVVARLTERARAWLGNPDTPEKGTRE